jgi:hypothetical protein
MNAAAVDIGPQEWRIDPALLDIGERIGHGAEGVVHLGVLRSDREPPRPPTQVCCKSLHALRNLQLYDVARGEEVFTALVAALGAEASLLASCRHPNIVQLHGKPRARCVAPPAALLCPRPRVLEAGRAVSKRRGCAMEPAVVFAAAFRRASHDVAGFPPTSVVHCPCHATPLPLCDVATADS